MKRNRKKIRIRTAKSNIISLLEIFLKKVCFITETHYPETAEILTRILKNTRLVLRKQPAQTPARGVEENCDLYWCYFNLFCFVQGSLGEV